MKSMLTACWSRRLNARGGLALVGAAALVSIGMLGLTLSCTASAAPPTFPAAQQEYWAHFDHRDWTAAITSAQKLVDDARAASPADPQRLADSLVLLGNAQLGSQNAVGAEAAYQEALDIVVPHVGPGSDKLIDPLRGLGYAFAAEGKHDKAAPLLDRALNISRRNFGLFDPSQQGLLRQLAASLTAVDAPLEAEKHIKYLLLIGERTYGGNDLRMIPLMCTVGDWYAQIGSLGVARQYFREGIALAEEKGGKSSVAAVEPLRGLAASYRRELFLAGAGLLRQPENEMSFGDPNVNQQRPITAQLLNSEGEKALLRAVKILDDNPNRPPVLLIQTLIDTGDWYQTRSQPQKALSFYRRAAAMIAPGEAATGSPFAFPVQVYLPTPLLATRNRTRPDFEVDEKFVQVEFTVTSDGAVKNARVIDQNGSSRQSSETLDAIQSARYRPKFVNGEPVETTAVVYRQLFRQRKEKDEDKDKKDEDKEKEKDAG
jgi:TonB family protein